MPANTSPIYTLTPKIGLATWTSSSTANTASDGSGTIGTNMLLAFTAGSQGSFIQRIRICPCATTSSTLTATVARVFISSITSGATTNANTTRFDEIAFASTSVDQTTSATAFQEIPCGFALTPNWTILVSMSATAAANTLFQFTVLAGDY